MADSVGLADSADSAGAAGAAVSAGAAGSAGSAGSVGVNVPDKTDHLVLSELWLDNVGMRAFMPDDFEPNIVMVLARLAQHASLYHELPRRMAMLQSVIDCALKSEAGQAGQAGGTAGTDVIYQVVKRLVKDEDYAAAKFWIVQAVKYGNLGAIRHSHQLSRCSDKSDVRAAVAAALVVNGEVIKHLGAMHWDTSTQAKYVLLAMKTYPDAKHHAQPSVRKLVDANSELLAEHYDRLVKLLKTNPTVWEDF